MAILILLGAACIDFFQNDSNTSEVSQSINFKMTTRKIVLMLHLILMSFCLQAYPYLHIRNKEFPWGNYMTRHFLIFSLNNFMFMDSCLEVWLYLTFDGSNAVTSIQHLFDKKSFTDVLPFFTFWG